MKNEEAVLAVADDHRATVEVRIDAPGTVESDVVVCWIGVEETDFGERSGRQVGWL